MEEIFLIPDALDRIRDFINQNLVDCVNSGLAVPEKECQIGVPFRPRNLLCIGLNYKDHQAGQEISLPAEPVIFAKLTGCVTGPGEPIVLPAAVIKVGYEAELAVVIGRQCRQVTTSDALNYVAGYTCLNDAGAPDLLRSDGQLVRAKSQDSFGPMGPYLVSREDIPNPQTLPIRSWVNGQLLQDSNTNQMIFGVRELIAYISDGITLEPADVISTGTPPRVGSAARSKYFSSPGMRSYWRYKAWEDSLTLFERNASNPRVVAIGGDAIQRQRTGGYTSRGEPSKASVAGLPDGCENLLIWTFVT